jgi:purine-binding chemotaxis protein CheW
MHSAQALGSPVPDATAGGMAQRIADGNLDGQYLAVRLGGEEFGIDIMKVNEVREYEPPLPLVGAPPGVKGVLNLRGAIVPVVDLRVLLQLEQAAFDDATVTVILGLGGRMVGAVMDAVSDVTRLGSGQIKPVPAFDNPIVASYLVAMGVQRQGERQRMILLMDIERVMRSAGVGPAHARAG